jgi:hypothetical protein
MKKNLKVVEITYSEGKTIQEDSYEPRSFHFSIKAEVSDNSAEELQDSYETIKGQVKLALNREVLKWTNPQKFIREERKTRLKEEEETAF